MHVDDRSVLLAKSQMTRIQSVDRSRGALDTPSDPMSGKNEWQVTCSL